MRLNPIPISSSCPRVEVLGAGGGVGAGGEARGFDTYVRIETRLQTVYNG